MAQGVLKKLRNDSAELRSNLQEAREEIAKLRDELSKDEDLPIREPALGLTAREEFRVWRLLELGKEGAIRKYQRELAGLQQELTLDDAQASALDYRQRAQQFGRDRKRVQREILIREFGEEQAQTMSTEAHERREVILAAAKSVQHRSTLRSIFNKKNPLSAKLIQAFAPNHH